MYIVHTIIKTRQQKLFFHILHDDFDGVQAIVKGGRLHEVILLIRSHLDMCDSFGVSQSEHDEKRT